MKTSGSLDTNIILRLLIGDVPSQTSRIETLLESDKTYAISDTVICEIAYTLKTYYQFPREKIAENIINLISLPSLAFDRQKYLDTIRYYLAHPALSWNDCLLAVEARITDNLPLFTFDKHLAHQLPEAVDL